MSNRDDYPRVIPKYADKPEDIPVGEHWAILTFGSIHIPGDERSRTHPGHGYPARNETKITYAYYDDEVVWKKEVERLTLQNDHRFVALKVNRPSLQTKTTVEWG